MSWSTFEGAFATPGIDAARETIEKELGWDGAFELNKHYLAPAIIDGSTRDAGNSPTTLLRPGLLLGRKTADLKCKEWSATAVDGTEDVFGILVTDMFMQHAGSNRDRWYWVLVGGLLKSTSILIPGNSSYSILSDALEWEVRRQLKFNFMLDNPVHAKQLDSDHRGMRRVIDLDASAPHAYTVKTTDHDLLFTTLGGTGASTFTLPAVAKNRGLRYSFFNAVDQDMTVASAAGDDIITFNDVAADSVAFSTTNEKVGAYVDIIGLDNSKWAAIPRGANTMTVAT